jgi:outer membrane protein OmpA-like peptidoglycan-associated protein
MIRSGMHQLVTIEVALVTLARPDAGELQFQDSKEAKGAAHAKPSKLVPTRTEAVLRFFVVDKDKGPVKGVVVLLTAPTGAKYHTDETDDDGYAEVLVPVGQKYEITYLSLGLARGNLVATETVSSEPRQTINLTLRYKRLPPPPPFVLTGVNFDTAKATIRPESESRLDVVFDFMKLKKSARVEISGHTDNVGNPRTNKTLSAKRAEACRAYLMAKGIDGSRITAVGYGAERPLAPNDSEDNRQKNRRIEVVELQAPASKSP